MFSGNSEDQTVALAGLFQSLCLVQALARDGGVTETRAYEVCMSSLLRIDADSALEVYDDAAGLRLGLEQLLRHLQGPVNQQGLEQASYAAKIMYLERRLGSDDTARNALGRALAALASSPAADDLDRLSQVQTLAGLYADHVSPLGPKVMISGNPTHLKREAVAARIRALLLAAVRAAVLWRQSGGSRAGMLLWRKRYARIARALMEHATP